MSKVSNDRPRPVRASRTARRRFLGLALAFPLLAVRTPRVRAATADAALAVIERFDDALLAVMKEATRLGYAGRVKRLAPVIERTYDFPFIVRIVMGAYWAGLDQAQRSELTGLFARYTVATYAARFDGYDGERFKALDQRPLRRGLVQVRTVLIKHDGSRVHLDYVLRQDGAAWRVVNVVAEGVSDLSLKRAEFGALMQQGGFAGLVAKLRQRIAAYASGKGV